MNDSKPPELPDNEFANDTGKPFDPPPISRESVDATTGTPPELPSRTAPTPPELPTRTKRSAIAKILAITGAVMILIGAIVHYESDTTTPDRESKVESPEFSKRGAPADATKFSGSPLLIIDPQGHSGLIHKLLFTPDGSTLISLGEDKTIRFWDFETGDLRRTIRGYIEDGLGGMLYAGALSPDGSILAVGGALLEAENGRGTAIHLIEIGSGEVVATLKGHTAAIRSLDFNQSGNFLASASSDHTIRLWKIPDIKGDLNAPVTITEATVLEGHEGPVTSICYNQNSIQLISASFDKTVRIWTDKNDGKFKQTVFKYHHDSVLSAEFTPDGQRFVTGGLDGQLVLVDPKLDSPRGFRPDAAPITRMAFSPDSKRLVTVGERSKNGKTPLAIYNISKREEVSTVEFHDNNIEGLAWHPTKNLIASAGGRDRQIIIWNPETGDIVRTMDSQGASGLAVGFDRAGQNRIAFGQTNHPKTTDYLHDRGPLTQVFDFTELKLTAIQPKEAGQQFQRAIQEYQGRRARPVDQFRLQLGKTEVALDPRFDGEIYSTSFTGGGDFIVGSRNSLRLFGHGGVVKNYEFRGHEGSVFAVAPSPDGRQFASTGLDQTIRIWNVDARGGELKRFMNHPKLGGGDAKHWIGALKGSSPSINGRAITSEEQLRRLIESKNPGESLTIHLQDKPWDFFVSESRRTEPVANLFVGKDGEWVCWLPSGHYHASAGGEKYIGWHFNRGVDQTGRFFPSFVFRDQFHHPELVKRTIELGDFDRAVADVGVNRVDQMEAILPPRIEWVEAGVRGGTTKSSQALVQAQILSPNSDLTEIKLLLNGKPVETERVPGGKVTVNFERTIDLVPGENRLAIFASNQMSGHLSEERVLKFHPQQANTPVELEMDQLPNLYLLSIGISEYKKSELNLNFCDDDASEFSRVLKAQEGRLFTNVESHLLLNARASRQAVIDNLEWLEQVATPRDVVVVFVASHGVNDSRGNYYLIPNDGDVDRLRSTGVSAADFVDILGNLPAKTLMFLDTCRSGQLGVNLNAMGVAGDDSTEAIRALTSQENGVIVMAASKGQEDSVESDDWGHGAFTLAILEGIETGRADFASDGIVFVRELDLFVSEKVIELTEGRQHPTTVRPSTISRFPLAKVR